MRLTIENMADVNLALEHFHQINSEKLRYADIEIKYNGGKREVKLHTGTQWNSGERERPVVTRVYFILNGEATFISHVHA